MKRNSTIISLESPYKSPSLSITPLPWISSLGINRCDGYPEFSGFTGPTLSVLQKAWQDFLDSGEELVIVPDPEPTPEPVEPDWVGFNTALLSDSYWRTIALQLESTPIGKDIKEGLVANAASGNAGGLRSSYLIAVNYLSSLSVPLDPDAIAAWEGYAQQYNIPVSFAIP